MIPTTTRRTTTDSADDAVRASIRRDILCLSSIDWQFIWQGHQEIMSTLAASGHRVLFVENTGIRTARLKDLPRLRSRAQNWWRGTKGFREDRPNLFIHSPLILPFPYSRLARRINRFMLVRSLRRWMRATGFGRPVIWTFLPTPLVHDLILELDPVVSVYYCIDDFASSSQAARRITNPEMQLFQRVDLVFVTSEKLRQRASRYAQRVFLFPFGVNCSRFDLIRDSRDEIPNDVREMRGPIAGYIGGIHQWIDFDLLAAAARLLPDVSFALVGPLQADAALLTDLPNVYLLGSRPHEDIPRYVKAFDVGIVPYRLSEYTTNVYPTKLNEYLAMGKPVVATDLPEIRRFNSEYGNIVRVASGAESFAEAIGQAVAGTSRSEIARRIEVAKTNSWPARIAEMWGLIEERVTARQEQGEDWEEKLRRLYRMSRRRVGWTAAGCVLILFLLFYTPLIWIVAEPLRVSAQPAPADAIVVFAGGVGESGRAGGGYQERVKRAAELFRAGWAPAMIFSSGFVFAFPESDVMKELAVGNGVPESSIILETKATNTYENVRHVRQILERRKWRRILLVSSPFHMRRAMLTWQKVAPEITVVPAPVPNSQYYVHDRGASVEQIRGILHEYAGIVVYWLRGWI